MTRENLFSLPGHVDNVRLGPHLPSLELATIIGEKPFVGISEAVKRLWTYVNENKLALGGNPCLVKVDEKLSRVFEGDTFNLNEVPTILLIFDISTVQYRSYVIGTFYR